MERKSGHANLTTLCKMAKKHEFNFSEVAIDPSVKHYIGLMTDGEKILGGGLKRGELITMCALPSTLDRFPKTNFSAYMAAEMLRRNPGLIVSFEESPRTRLMADMEGYGKHG